MSLSKSQSLSDEESHLSSHPSSVDEVPNYPNLVEHRMILPGRAVFFNNQQLVYERLASRGWDSLCLIPTPCFPDLVRKFYAEAYIPPVRSSFVIYSKIDQCPVSISVNDIASAFNIRREPASQYPLTFESLKTNLTLIASALRGKRSHELFDLKYNDLIDEYRFLYEITIANLLPAERSNNIPLNISTFLYAVMSNYQVDLASLIWNEIVERSKFVGLEFGPLPYGSLISHLLFREKVNIPPNVVSSRPIDPIGSVKMLYQDMTDCHSFGDIGVCLSLVSKDVNRNLNKIFSRIDQFDSLFNSHEALRSRVNDQEVRLHKILNGGFLSYEEEEAIEKVPADD